jgi:hypothetical protein
MRLVRKVPKSVNRPLTSLLSGAIAFVLSFAMVLIGTYIKCFFNDVEFTSSIALVGAGWALVQSSGSVPRTLTCDTGIGCIAAGWLFLDGIDNAHAGYQTISNGAATPTWGGQVLQSLGMSASNAELLCRPRWLVPTITRGCRMILLSELDRRHPDVPPPSFPFSISVSKEEALVQDLVRGKPSQSADSLLCPWSKRHLNGVAVPPNCSFYLFVPK